MAGAVKEVGDWGNCTHLGFGATHRREYTACTSGMSRGSWKMKIRMSSVPTVTLDEDDLFHGDGKARKPRHIGMIAMVLWRIADTGGGTLTTDELASVFGMDEARVIKILRELDGDVLTLMEE